MKARHSAAAVERGGRGKLGSAVLVAAKYGALQHLPSQAFACHKA
jgi:hypothetical protein